MPNYVFAYSGGTRPESEEAGNEVMAAWMGWFDGLGSAVVEIGNPFSSGKMVSSNGDADGAADLTGYSVIQAGDFDEAVKFTDGCPQLAAGGKVAVYETYEVM
jgi:hypothetical protein